MCCSSWGRRVRHDLATEQQLYSQIGEVIPSIPILQMIKLRSMNINQFVNITELVTDRTEAHIQAYLEQNTYFSFKPQHTSILGCVWGIFSLCFQVFFFHLFSLVGG